jgi:hypothetical protein
MPPNRFFLILAAVIVAAGLTVWLGASLSDGGPVSAAVVGLGLLVVAVLWRLVAGRLR